MRLLAGAVGPSPVPSLNSGGRPSTPNDVFNADQHWFDGRPDAGNRPLEDLYLGWDTTGRIGGWEGIHYPLTKKVSFSMHTLALCASGSEPSISHIDVNHLSIPSHVSFLFFCRFPLALVFHHTYSCPSHILLPRVIGGFLLKGPSLPAYVLLAFWWQTSSREVEPCMCLLPCQPQLSLHPATRLMHAFETVCTGPLHQLEYCDSFLI